LTSHTKGRTQIDKWTQNTEENIFRPMREEETKGWREIHSPRLRNFYS